MKLEIRADGLHITGYVNATEKKSRPVITPRGKVVEIIEPRAFENALKKAENVPMTKDHDETPLAETRAGTLELYEDPIGLHADAHITDEQTIEEARAGKIKGWSFAMMNVEDSIEERAGELPIRHVTGFDLDHVTLVVNKTPCYAATSVEMRAEDDVTAIEQRGFTEYKAIVVTESVERYHDDGTVETERATVEKTERTYDNSEYRRRADALKPVE